MAKFHSGIKLRRITLAYIRKFLKVFTPGNKLVFIDATEYHNNRSFYKIKIYVNKDGELIFQSKVLECAIAGIIEYSKNVVEDLDIPPGKPVLDFAVFPKTYTE